MRIGVASSSDRSYTFCERRTLDAKDFQPLGGEVPPARPRSWA